MGKVCRVLGSGLASRGFRGRGNLSRTNYSASFSVEKQPKQSDSGGFGGLQDEPLSEPNEIQH